MTFWTDSSARLARIATDAGNAAPSDSCCTPSRRLEVPLGSTGGGRTCTLAVACAALACLAPPTGHASDTALPSRPSAWTVDSSVELGAQIAGETNLFWNLAAIAAPDAGFDPDRYWWEFYVEPGVAFAKPLANERRFYARLSAVGSATLRHDAFDAGDSGRLTVEDAVVGLAADSADKTVLQWDISAGAQTYTVGTGMLIANGASNGFERGALKLGPRKAYQTTAIGRLGRKDWSVQAFYLEPNENPDSSSDTHVAGALLEYKPEAGRFAGLAYAKVIDSKAPYPQAAPGGIGAPRIIDGARDGLSFLYAYGRWPLASFDAGQLWAGIDVAEERNDRIRLRASGGRAELGFVAAAAWQPKLTLGYQSFSGDDPNTPQLERFDPLNYEGSPGAWATGSKSSMVFINTNVRAVQLTLEIQPSPRDLLSLYLAHVRANELRSPLQFGQATRLEYTDGVPALVAGVTDAHLADDLFLKYTRVVDAHTYVTAGFSASFPGTGIDRLLGSHAPVWTGWLVNVVFAY